MSVSDYVDLQTSSNPSLPKTTGVPKTYSVAFSAKNNKKKNNNNLAGLTGQQLQNCINHCTKYSTTGNGGRKDRTSCEFVCAFSST
jgi:hypothetical protein